MVKHAKPIGLERHIMFPNYNDFLVAQEQHKDLLREVERKRLIRAAKLQRPGNWGVHQKVAGWIGDQMVSWGCKLQGYDTAALACCPQVATYQ
jgi:hypothetical protein